MIKPTKPGRANRIADQIQRDVAELIQKEVSNPKTGLVTLTGCEITPDYAHATIYFTSIGSTPEEATEALNSAAPSGLRPTILPLRRPPGWAAYAPAPMDREDRC